MYKSASGCLEHINIFQVSNINTTLKYLREKNFWIYGFDSKSKKDFTDIKWEGNIVLLFGSEGHGIKKNTDTVVLAEVCLIKYINIVKAPKETNNIWWLIAIIKVEEKSMKGFAKNKTIIRWNINPPIAWYILLTGNDKLLLNFFCHKVAQVTAIKDIKTAIIPIVGSFVPTSKPKTIVAPKKPSMTPTHCFHVTFSFSNGPAKALVSIGLRVTTNAAIPVGRPFDIEKNTHPR